MEKEKDRERERERERESHPHLISIFSFLHISPIKGTILLSPSNYDIQKVFIWERRFTVHLLKEVMKKAQSRYCKDSSDITGHFHFQLFHFLLHFTFKFACLTNLMKLVLWYFVCLMLYLIRQRREQWELLQAQRVDCCISLTNEKMQKHLSTSSLQKYCLTWNFKSALYWLSEHILKNCPCTFEMVL